MALGANERSERVLYGMAVLFFGYSIARKMFNSPAAALSTLLILAVAPLLITTSHFGTGDIGVDLFTALMLFMLCLHSERQKPIYIFLAGISLGIAFGCKYQGLLGGIAIGLYITIIAALSKSAKRFVGYTLLSLTGCLAGAVLVTPAFLINWKRTWKDMRINFSFVRDYGLSSEFLEKPLLERVAFSFSENLPRIIGSIGWGLFFVATAGLIVCISINFTKLLSKRKGDRREPIDALGLAFFTYGFATLIISVAGKAAPQVFHFSYTLLPITLSAVYFLTALWRTKNIAGRALSLGLSALIIGELAVITEQEHFFWSRPDSGHIARNLPRRLFSDQSLTGRLGNIKSIILEPGQTIPVFRNRRSHLLGPHTEDWRDVHILPVPEFPYPISSDWVFVNGPVFPRSDRMFFIGNDRSLSRMLVYEENPEKIHLGIRSGDLPILIKGEIGGQKLEINMPPNKQELITVAPEKIRTIKRYTAEDYRVCFVAADLEVYLGSAVISFMADQREIDNFMLYGNQSRCSQSISPPDVSDSETIEKLFGTALFYEETFADQIEIDCAGTIREQRVNLPRHKIPIPAGIYSVEIDIYSEADGNLILIEYDDPLGLNALGFNPKTFTLQKGDNTVSFNLSKTFSPLMSRFVISITEGKAFVESLKIEPDLKSILDELDNWNESGNEAIWFESIEARATAKAPSDHCVIAFGRGIQFMDLSIPESIVRGDELKLRCPVNIVDFNIREFMRLFVFLHFMDDQGQQVLALEAPLWMAANTIDNDIEVPFGAVEIPAGSYKLKMGIYNNRTLKRMNITDGMMQKYSTRRRRVDIGTINVVNER